MAAWTICLTVFVTVFLAEMGDKTQLLLVAMAGRHRVSHILIGTWSATVVLNLLAVLAGAALSAWLDLRIVKSVAALAFLWFAYAALREDDEAENAHATGGRWHPAIAIFGTFFLGELGDKTQLSTIALAATYTQSRLVNAAAVFAGSTVGLILADLIGLLAGIALRSKLQAGVLNWISFGIFTLFGAVNGYTAARLMLPTGAAVAVVAVVLAAFAALCVRKKRK